MYLYPTIERAPMRWDYVFVWAWMLIIMVAAVTMALYSMP
jgi:hypothetical protein